MLKTESAEDRNAIAAYLRGMRYTFDASGCQDVSQYNYTIWSVIGVCKASMKFHLVNGNYFEGEIFFAEWIS